MTQEEFGDQYAYKDVEEYEAITGTKFSMGMRMIWDMARTKNKHLGIFDFKKEEPETEQP